MLLAQLRFSHLACDHLPPNLPPLVLKNRSLCSSPLAESASRGKTQECVVLTSPQVVVP